MGLFDKLKSGIKGVAERVTGQYGAVELHLESDTFSPGDTVPVRVSLKAESEFQVTSLKVTLEGNSDVRYTDDDSDNERNFLNNDSFVVAELELGANFEMGEGQSKDFNGEILVPIDTCLSYDGEHCDCAYFVRVDVDVPKAVDLKQEEQVTIVSRIPENIQILESTSASRDISIKFQMDRSELEPGSETPYRIEVTASKDVEVFQYRVYLTATESFEFDEEGDDDTHEYEIEYLEVPDEPTEYSAAIQEGQTEVIEGTLTLPDEMNPTCSSEYFKNEYQFKVGVDIAIGFGSWLSGPIVVHSPREGQPT